MRKLDLLVFSCLFCSCGFLTKVSGINPSDEFWRPPNPVDYGLERLHEGRGSFFTHPEIDTIVCYVRLCPGQEVLILHPRTRYSYKVIDTGWAKIYLVKGTSPEKDRYEYDSVNRVLTTSMGVFYFDGYSELPDRPWRQPLKVRESNGFDAKEKLDEVERERRANYLRRRQ